MIMCLATSAHRGGRGDAFAIVHPFSKGNSKYVVQVVARKEPTQERASDTGVWQQIDSPSCGVCINQVNSTDACFDKIVIVQFTKSLPHTKCIFETAE